MRFVDSGGAEYKLDRGCVMFLRCEKPGTFSVSFSPDRKGKRVFFCLSDDDSTPKDDKYLIGCDESLSEWQARGYFHDTAKMLAYALGLRINCLKSERSQIEHFPADSVLAAIEFI